MAAASGRLEPMNASPHHAKIRVTIHLADPLFVAGEEIVGKMEMDCRADKGLGIGVMMIELFAIQELSSRDHSATSTFLTSRRLFQGPSLPPSNAVLAHLPPGAPALPAHHYQARKGISTFFFRFPLPLNSPSSINFGSGLAKIRYQLRASVGVAWKGEKRLVTDFKEADVAECLTEDPSLALPSTVVGEGGKMWVQGRVVGGVAVAGQPACVELTVKNHTAKKTTGVTLTLTRSLILQNSAPSKNPFHISDTLLTENFKSAEYCVPPGVEGVANLVFDVPKHARGVRGGTREGGEEDEPRFTEGMFEVKCVVSVKIGMAVGSKDLNLDIPVTVIHSRALPEQDPFPAAAAPQDPYSYGYPLEPPRPHFAQGPVYGSPHSSPQLPPSASPHLPTPPPLGYIQGYPQPPQPPQSPYLYPSHATPPLSQSPMPYYSTPPLSAQHSGQPQQAYYYPPPQPVYAAIPGMPIPPRALSAEPIHPGLPHSQSYAGPGANSYALPPNPTLSHPGSGVHPGVIPSRALPGVPVPAGAEHGVLSEEGKGLRASRISASLKKSSRNRSVSPVSHRHPLPVVLPKTITPPPASQQYPAPPAHPSQHPSQHQSVQQYPHPQLPPLQAPERLSQPEVLSPRPMLSPKASFSMELAGGENSTLSGRVQALEIFAAKADAAANGGALDLNAGEEELDVKDLVRIMDANGIGADGKPTPPAPVGKPLQSKFNNASAVPKASDIFAPPGAYPASHGVANAPASGSSGGEPEKTSSGGNRHLRTPGGLAALEKRLVSEVGTRKNVDVKDGLKKLEEAVARDKAAAAPATTLRNVAPAAARATVKAAPPTVKGQTLKLSGANGVNEMGMSALERRLQAEVGTRKHTDMRDGLKKLDEAIARDRAAAAKPSAATIKSTTATMKPPVAKPSAGGSDVSDAEAEARFAEGAWNGATVKASRPSPAEVQVLAAIPKADKSPEAPPSPTATRKRKDSEATPTTGLVVPPGDTSRKRRDSVASSVSAKSGKAIAAAFSSAAKAAGKAVSSSSKAVANKLQQVSTSKAGPSSKADPSSSPTSPSKPPSSSPTASKPSLFPTRDRPKPKTRHSADPKEDEMQRLRKAAKGRITAWLGAVDMDDSSKIDSPPSRFIGGGGGAAFPDATGGKDVAASSTDGNGGDDAGSEHKAGEMGELAPPVAAGIFRTPSEDAVAKEDERNATIKRQEMNGTVKRQDMTGTYKQPRKSDPAATASLLLRNAPRRSSGFVSTSKIMATPLPPAVTTYQAKAEPPIVSPMQESPAEALPSPSLAVDLPKSTIPPKSYSPTYISPLLSTKSPLASKASPTTAKPPPPPIAPKSPGLVSRSPFAAAALVTSDSKPTALKDVVRASSPEAVKLKPVVVSPKPKPRTFLPPPSGQLSPPVSDQPKYDYKSARGGKGGVVTSVAALWANAAAEADKDKTDKSPAGTKPLVVGRVKTTTQALPAALTPSSPGPPVLKPTSPGPVLPPRKLSGASGTSVPPLASPRLMGKVDASPLFPSSPSSVSVPEPEPVAPAAAPQRFMKSPSVPARLSLPIAKPTLSSTASLARPSDDNIKRRLVGMNLPPTISESKSDPKVTTTTATSTSSAGVADTPRRVNGVGRGRLSGAVSTGGISTLSHPTTSPPPAPPSAAVGVGRAKLKDLINKYQQA